MYFIDIYLLVVLIKCQYCKDKYSGNIARLNPATVLFSLQIHLHMESILLMYCLILAITKTNVESEHSRVETLDLWR